MSEERVECKDVRGRGVQKSLSSPAVKGRTCQYLIPEFIDYIVGIDATLKTISQQSKLTKECGV